MFIKQVKKNINNLKKKKKINKTSLKESIHKESLMIIPKEIKNHITQTFKMI